MSLSQIVEGRTPWEEKPLFLYVSHQSPHSQLPQHLEGKFRVDNQTSVWFQGGVNQRTILCFFYFEQFNVWCFRTALRSYSETCGRAVRKRVCIHVVRGVIDDSDVSAPIRLINVRAPTDGNVLLIEA